MLPAAAAYMHNSHLIYVCVCTTPILLRFAQISMYRPSLEDWKPASMILMFNAACSGETLKTD